MKKYILIVALAFSLNGFSQLTVPPNGGNKKAWVGEKIGITDVTIHYDRPAVKGREDKIFGQLVPYGFNDLGFGTSKAAPWRAGANENTNIEFSTDVKINGKDLPAGKYGFFVATDPNNCTLIFSKNSTSWGSYFYDEKEDALRVTAAPVENERSTEWLTYAFTEQMPNSAVIILTWEKYRLPFKVEVDLEKTQMESIVRELRSEKGFNSKALNQAAQYTLDHHMHLDKGLTWANESISGPFGEVNFTNASTKAGILEKMGKQAEADATMKSALPAATMLELHNYARRLIAAKKAKEALEIFQMNYNKNPNVYTTNIGLARGYSALGDYKKALDYAKKGLAQAPDELNKNNVAQLISQLQQGKDIN